MAAPFHQMQQYYRYGEFDTCFGKWNALVDCLTLKTKKSSEVKVSHHLLNLNAASYVVFTMNVVVCFAYT